MTDFICPILGGILASICFLLGCFYEERKTKERVKKRLAEIRERIARELPTAGIMNSGAPRNCNGESNLVYFLRKIEEKVDEM